MASTIRIKRRSSGSTGSPATLKNAELAMNEVDSTLYYGVGSDVNGDATSVIALAGPGAFTTLSTTQTISGNKTLSGTVNASGTFQLNGTTVSATAAELNKVSGVTAGVASASKFLLVDASKDLDLDGGDLTVMDMVVEGNLTVQGTTTTINTTDLVVKDKLVEIAAVDTPTDVTANGAGIRVKGATDKDFKWNSVSGAFKSTENLEVASGKVFKVDGVEVLSGSALGSGVTGSSLTSVGTISSGTWQGTAVGISYGGTGQTTAQLAINALSAVSGASAGQVLTKVGSDAVWSTPTDTGITSLNGLGDTTQTFAYGTSGTAPAWSSAAGVHTLNIPNAGSGVTGGLLTNGVQAIYGDKTFHNTINVDLGGVYSRGGGINPALNGVGYSASVPVIRGKGVNSQSANLLELLNSSDATQFAVGPTGAVTSGSWTATAVGVSYGGTGATSAGDARTNLGLAIGSDVQAYSANLGAIAGLTSAANKLPYFTGSGTAAVTDLTSFGRTLIDDASASDARATLGVVIGTDVQPFDARLDAIADLSGSFSAGTVKLVGFSATNTAEYVDVTTFGQSLINDASAGDARTTLGLVIGTDVQAQDAELSAIAGLTSAANKLPYFTGSGTAALADFSSFGRSLVDDADAESARSTLGLVIGANVQAYDAELSAIAGLTSAANKGIYFTGSGAADVYDLTSFGRTLAGSADAEAARTSLSLGSMSLQNSSSVSITGGSIDGITLDGGSY